MPISLPSSSAPVPRTAAGGCVRCAVRHYCAVYAPHSVGPPADCPFGPGSGRLPFTRK